MNNFIEKDVSLEKCPALVLNADYRPLSYYPLSLWSWQDTVKSVFLDRVIIVSNYDRVVRSPSFNMQLPSVIALKDYIVPQSKPSFTRFNVFLRDKFSCQYCGSNEELTFDHLLPRSKGGQTNWDNVVTACSACNVTKGGKLLKNSDMKLNQYPYRPSTEDLHKNGKNFPPNYLHKSWMDYLYWTYRPAQAPASAQAHASVQAGASVQAHASVQAGASVQADARDRQLRAER